MNGQRSTPTGPTGPRMGLRQRIVLTLAVMALVLTIPSLYSLLALSQLRTIVHDFRVRDAEALLSLGRLQQAVTATNDAQVRYAALGADPRAAVLRARVDSTAGVVARSLAELAQRGYGTAADSAAEHWNDLGSAIEAEHELRAEGDARADSLQQLVIPAGFERMDALLTPIGRAIEQRGSADLERAETVVFRAVNTAMGTLVATLAAALLIGALLTRSLLRPIGDLRRGMAAVAQGDFEPDDVGPTARGDELGDLARSFERMTVQLRELDRLKAEFVGVASHEIKTPLSVIRGYVTLLADGIYGEVNDVQRRTLESVNSQTDRLNRLVHRLLDVSRFEAGGARLELRGVHLAAFLEDLTSGFRVLAMQNGITFEVRVSDDLPESITVDEDRLNEVLGNLLSNAFKFTESGGTIRLEASRAADGIVVEVEDTGVGIPADKLPHVFEKFYQVDNAAQPRSVGSGLGLAIAREIVEAHGGTIAADSEVGRGTRFRVMLPEHPPVQAPD
jgi:signal transduction histidine kinase